MGWSGCGDGGEGWAGLQVHMSLPVPVVNFLWENCVREHVSGMQEHLATLISSVAFKSVL